MAETTVTLSSGANLGPRDWLIKELKNLSPEARKLFEQYSKIPSDEVIPHITQFRDKAFTVYPYPCLGQWGFLDLSIRASPQYDELVQRIKNGDKYLDLGCCVGQDIRALVADGAPSENIYGSDLKQDFLEIGYNLFLDRSTLNSTFIGADIFDHESGLKAIEGTIDIVHTASFFHLFDWEQQVQAAKRVVTLLQPRPGSLIVGRQVGNTTAGEWARVINSDRKRYRHNEESFERMWKDVGEETGTKWEVDAKLADHDVETQFDFVEVGTRWLRFSVRRL